MNAKQKFIFIISAIAALATASCASREEQIRTKIISCAKKYLGRPYDYSKKQDVLGDPKRGGGFDCSGFTLTVIKEATGITLPHASSSIAVCPQVKKIPYSQLKPGDFVFFNTFATGVTHVGIYLGYYSGKEGTWNDAFIHSASDGSRTGVTVHSLSDKWYWKECFDKLGKQCGRLKIFAGGNG